MGRIYGPVKNQESCNKGEILFECDAFEGVALKQGVIYYLNTDCTFNTKEYQKGYYKYDGTDFVPFGSGDCDYGLPKLKEQLTDYVWKMEYDHLDYIYASENIDNGYTVNGACTAIYKNGWLGRNFDWYFSKEIEAVVRTKDTIATCGGLPELTQEKIIGGTADKGDLKLLPFYVRDGMNSGGLACCINVVPSTGNTASVPTERTEHTISAPCLCRFILDNFDNAEEACEHIQKFVSIVFATGVEYEVHYFIADKNKCYCLEVVNNEVVYQEANAMTNFHLDGIDWKGEYKVYTPQSVADYDLRPHRDQLIDEYGEGLERYNEVVDGLDNVAVLDDMFDKALDKVLYTKIYKVSSYFTDFVGDDLTVDNVPSDFSTIMAEAHNRYESFDDDEARREDGTLWHTAHSSVYDIQNNIMRIKFNENTETTYTYTLPFRFNDCFTVVDGELCVVYESED